jgi:hypothetical protein
MAIAQQMLEATATIIADYRKGEITRPDAAHIQSWLNQFDECAREPLLAEMTHVLGQTYVSKANVEKFLAGLATHKNLAGDDPTTFWRGVKFLDIQKRGHSQREFLQLFSVPLKQRTGLVDGI